MSFDEHFDTVPPLIPRQRFVNASFRLDLIAFLNPHGCKVIKNDELPCLPMRRDSTQSLGQGTTTLSAAVDCGVRNITKSEIKLVIPRSWECAGHRSILVYSQHS